jgi:UDP-glucose 4-epimerase
MPLLTIIKRSLYYVGAQNQTVCFLDLKANDVYKRRVMCYGASESTNATDDLSMGLKKMVHDIKKVLVTGGAGFIGSHLVDALVDRKCDVGVVDNLSGGSLSNLEHLKGRIDFCKGDIRDVDAMKRMANGCDTIFHLAAMVSVPQTVEDPVLSSSVNDTGTLMVLEAARQADVSRVVLSSSCAVYGDDPQVPKNENMNLKPQSPYAVQKLTNELYAGLYAELYGLETVCLRYFNVYGPRQDPSSPYSGVISIFMTRAAEKAKPVIYGDGNQYRDFVFVKDVVQANLNAALAQDASGEIFNIGSGQYVRINDLWQRIAGLANVNMTPEYQNYRAGDILESVADIKKASKGLGFTPAYGFEEGLKITYDWYRSQ